MAIDWYPPPKRPTRRTEILLALVAVASQALFWSTSGGSGWPGQETVLGYALAALYWGSPVLLALTAVLSVAVDDVGVGSVLSVGGALVTLYVVGISVYTLVDPPDGGGVFFGHVLTTLAVTPFAVLVLLRRALNRLFARLWLRVGELYERHVPG